MRVPAGLQRRAAVARRSPALLPSLAAALAIVSGCAGPGPARSVGGVDPGAAPCVRALYVLEERASSLGITPSDPRAMAGYPELARDRVLASYDPAALSSAARADWLARLAEAGRQRRELLRSALVAHGAADGNGSAGPLPDTDGAALEDCAATLAARRSTEPDAWPALAAAAQVPDDYRTVRRVLGLYPLSAIAVGMGIRTLHDEVAATFAAPLDTLPVQGELRRWQAGTARPAERPFPPAAARDALGVRPDRIDDATLDALFAYHAPVLEIDVAGPADRPGAPRFTAAGEPTVDTDQPAAYRYARVMPLAGELRLQLVYVFWFEARPRRNVFDTLGGAIDGLVWRVTLDRDGAALVYDSIHPCGCYHHFFASERLALREAVVALPEPPLLPQAAPVATGDDRIVLRVASATHYLQRVYTDRGTGAHAVVDYALRDYGALYAVPGPQGPRSFFASNGLVPGTQRGERFYLWPMGVPSPGAMRERGRQATAFLGRRHFDDATLLDGIFRLAPHP